MENHPLYTRKYFLLDARVWITLGAVILASLGLVGYTRIFNKQDLKCPSIQIFVNGKPDIENLTYHINEPIAFRSNVEPSDEVEWNFADGTHERGPIAIHSFKQPGNYSVRATVNNRCPYEQIITIIPDIEIPENSEAIIGESIVGEVEVNVGVEVIYETFLEAEDYEWYIQNNRTYPRQKGNSARFTFKSQGNYVLILQLNNGREYMKEIIVYKKDGNSGAAWLTPVPLLPPEPVDVDTIKKEPTKKDTIVAPPKGPKFVRISDAQFHNYLQSLACGRVSIEFFDQHFCSGVNTKVLVNGDEPVRLVDFHNEIKSKKKIKIERVVVGRDKEGCIINLQIYYDKKSFLSNPCK